MTIGEQNEKQIVVSKDLFLPSYEWFTPTSAVQYLADPLPVDLSGSSTRKTA